MVWNISHNEFPKNLYLAYDWSPRKALVVNIQKFDYLVPTNYFKVSRKNARYNVFAYALEDLTLSLWWMLVYELAKIM